MDAQSLKQLIAVLDQQMLAAQALTEMLSRERALLTGVDAAAVEAAAAEKATLLNRIESLETDRRRVLAIAGRGASGTEMDRICRASAAGAPPSTLQQQVGERWHQLIGVMERCREANEVNGAIVGLKQRQIRQLLNVLRTGREDDLTYGRGGRTQSGTARGLARA